MYDKIKSMSKHKDILFIIPFILIVIFGGALTFFSFNASYEKLRAVTVDDISRSVDDLPPQINRDYSKHVSVDLEAVAVVAEFDDGKTYEYWTFNKQVPGPFIRVREGDTVEITLTHLRKVFIKQNSSHSHGPSDIERIRAIKTDGAEELDRFEYSIDLQSVLGPAGADLMKVGLGETKSFEFKATSPGLYMYTGGGSNASTYIARGMYGLILVEPINGLSRADKEYYVTEGEIYTDKGVGKIGFHKIDEKKLSAKTPSYTIFNGRVDALEGDGVPVADTGDVVRIFFGNSGQNTSSLNIIANINLQSTSVPTREAVMIEIVSQ